MEMPEWGNLGGEDSKSFCCGEPVVYMLYCLEGNLEPLE